MWAHPHPPHAAGMVILFGIVGAMAAAVLIVGLAVSLVEQ